MLSPAAVALIAGPGGTVIGVLIAWALNRNAADDDRLEADRREWEHSIETQLAALTDKVDTLRERAAEHTALLRYFLPRQPPRS